MGKDWRDYLALAALTLLLCTFLFGGCTQNSEDAAMDATPTPAKTDPFELNRRLGRGVNLGNALEAPQEGEWGMTLREEYFKLIGDAGFDAVRIPIRWSAHADESEPFTIDPAFFERVDWAIEQAMSNDLLAVINIHHYEEIMQDPQAHKGRFLALWKQIAEHYQGYSAELLFELLNEPNTGLGPSTWNTFLQETISAVRQSNPKRALVVGPANWNNVSMLGFLELPDDDNLIVTVHYYDPFQFTHQGAEWVEGSDPWLGTTWEGTEIEMSGVLRSLDAAASWGEKHNRPLFLGEFGAYGKADIDSRARWTSFVAREAEKRDMSWAYWEFGAGFGVYDRARRGWNQRLLDALLPQD